MKQINIDISPEGEVKIDASGFRGKGCTEATQQIEIALGGSAPKQRKMKPEGFMANAGTNKTRVF